MVTNELLKSLTMNALEELSKLNLVFPGDVKFEVSRRLKKNRNGYYAERRQLDGFTFDASGNRVRKYKTVEKKIVVSAYLPLHSAKETVMHEMLHAVAGLDVGHGPEWQKLVRLVNTTFGYDIGTYTSVTSGKLTKEYRQTLNLALNNGGA
jgi:hypothetical protein